MAKDKAYRLTLAHQKWPPVAHQAVGRCPKWVISVDSRCPPYVRLAGNFGHAGSLLIASHWPEKDRRSRRSGTTRSPAPGEGWRRPGSRGTGRGLPHDPRRGGPGRRLKRRCTPATCNGPCSLVRLSAKPSVGPVWDRAAEMILLAAETGKRADIAEATRQNAHGSRARKLGEGLTRRIAIYAADASPVSFWPLWRPP